jgi:hypothetical protein
MEKEMKKTFILGALLILSACASGPIMVTNVNIPQEEIKVGKSCNHMLLGIIPIGTENNSTYKAKEAGGISQVATVDAAYKWWVIGGSNCTIVTGK